MTTPGPATLDAIESAARDVTYQLPEAHRYTGFARTSSFITAATRLRDLVFQVDPIELSDEDFEQVPRAIEASIKAIEIHMLASDDTVALRQVLDDLRAALDGIVCGLPADPKRRPSREEMSREGGERLLNAMLDRA